MLTEEAITYFDDTVRKLRVQYHLFFSGLRKLPPTEDRRRLDALVQELSRSRIRDNALRFRYTTLLGRYNQLQELWNRQMREREEGPLDFKRRMAAYAAEGEIAPPPPPPPAAASRAAVTSEAAEPYVKISSASNGGALSALHAQVSAAQEQLGKPGLSIEQLAAMVQQQASALRARYGVETIGFRVETVNGKVKLKARPIQES